MAARIALPAMRALEQDDVEWRATSPGRIPAYGWVDYARAAASASEDLCLNKGYDYEQPEQDARARGVNPHIRRRWEPALTGPIRGKKPRRWVVERTNSWHNNFRAVRISWDWAGPALARQV